MRLLLTSVSCPKGQLATNGPAHLDLLRAGARQRCDLVLLPEMSLTGYRPSAAIPLDHPAVESLVAATVDAPAFCFGFVEDCPAGPPFITQVVAAGGELVAVHRKAHLGDGEEGSFQSGLASGLFEIAGVSCSLAVCAEIGTPAPYRLGSRLVLGPAAPGLYGERRSTAAQWRAGYDWWRGSVTDDGRRLLQPRQQLAVSTQAGPTEDEDFPGWAGLVGADGGILSELPDGRPGCLVVEVGALTQA